MRDISLHGCGLFYFSFPRIPFIFFEINSFFFRFAAPLSYRRIFSFANSTTQPKVICLVQDVTAEHKCNRLDANMLHTCSAVSAVYRGRLLLARSHFHADHAGSH